MISFQKKAFQINMSKMNIGRIIKQKEHFSGLDVGHLGDSKRLQKSQCLEAEEATFIWFTTMQENNVALSDDFVVAVAKRFMHYFLEVLTRRSFNFLMDGCKISRRDIISKAIPIIEKTHQLTFLKRF